MKRAYIDFDNTLFNVKILKNRMLESISKEICKQKNKNFDEIFQELSDMFCSEKIYNIVSLCEYFADKYGANLDSLIDGVNFEISNCKDCVYDDSFEFLKMLAQKKYEINILTYTATDRYEYQMRKILGSGIDKFIDNIYICTKNKGLLGLNYDDNSIFVDDNPDQIISLHDAGVDDNRLFWKKRSEKYSSTVFKFFKPIVVESLSEIKLD